MKVYSLSEGEKGAIGTVTITNDPRYNFVIQTIKQIRDRMLSFVNHSSNILTAVHKDDSDFPDEFKPCTPVEEQVSNQVKIKQFRNNLPPTQMSLTS